MVLQDIATIDVDTTAGEYDRSGPRRFVTVSANLYKKDLKTGTDAVNKAISSLGPLPKGLVIDVLGTSQLLTETLDGLQNGLLLAIIVIFLLLAANYQSFRASLAVLSAIPAVLLGALGHVTDYRLYAEPAIVHGYYHVYRRLCGQCYPDCDQRRAPAAGI